MSSTNKKKKLKNSYQCPSGLKEDNLKGGVKRTSFYTSSARQKLKEELERDIQELDDDYTTD